MTQTKWVTVRILNSIKLDIDELCKKEKEFSNTSQFIGYVLRKELESREKFPIDKTYFKKSISKVNTKKSSKTTSTQREMKLMEKMREACKNDKSHTKVLFTDS